MNLLLFHLYIFLEPTNKDSIWCKFDKLHIAKFQHRVRRNLSPICVTVCMFDGKHIESHPGS